MDDEHIKDLFENQKDTLGRIDEKIDKIEERQIEMQKDMAGIKVWIWVGRGVFVTWWAGMVVWVKTFLKD